MDMILSFGHPPTKRSSLIRLSEHVKLCRYLLEQFIIFLSLFFFRKHTPNSTVASRTHACGSGPTARLSAHDSSWGWSGDAAWIKALEHSLNLTMCPRIARSQPLYQSSCRCPRTVVTHFTPPHSLPAHALKAVSSLHSLCAGWGLKALAAR
jgi:hypothetical protein